ncbi:MAG: flagellar basal body rod protein FlgF [Gammaproteobacteria bacterium]
MDRSLYIAMSGAKQTLLAQASNTNNLANSQTVAFKSDLDQFRSQPVFGPGYPSRVYAMTERPGTNLAGGPIQTTGRELDVAVNGPGWIAVLGSDGREAYTRAGDLHITPEGLLQTGAGHTVVGNQGPIAIPPSEKLEIGRDGTINAIPLSENPNNIAVTDRIKLVDPPLALLVKGEDGLMRLKQGEALPDAGVKLVQGALEMSNVNAVEAMVNMIELSKNFDLQVKLMRETDENSAATARLMQMT